MRASIAALALLSVASAVACGSSDDGAHCGVDSGVPDSTYADEPIVLGDDASVDGSLDGSGDAVVDDAAGFEVGALAPAPGASGAFGVVTVAGKQKLYLPQQVVNGQGVVAAVDVGVAGAGTAGAPALVKAIALGNGNVATVTGGDATMIVAASGSSPDVWFIDPTTDTLVGHITLDATFGTSNFSGTGGFVMGIAVDTAAHVAYLGVWNGFAVVDLPSRSVTKVIPAPPSENFAFDSVHHRLYAPFYGCANAQLHGVPPPVCTTPTSLDGGVMLSGMSVIDLTDDTVYTYEDDTAPNPSMPLGPEPDGAAVDTSTQIVVVPAETSAPPFDSFIDFSKASFDKTNATVTAPRVILSNFIPDGVAVEPTSHLALLEEEGTNVVFALDALQAAAGSPAYVQATMPTIPGGLMFQNLGDPHGVTTALSILPGTRPVGFLVDTMRRWVARVDLGQFVALEQVDAGAVMATTMQLAPAVTYLDANTLE